MKSLKPNGSANIIALAETDYLLEGVPVSVDFEFTAVVVVDPDAATALS